MTAGIDLLVVGIDATRGWTEAAAELAASARRAGATVAAVGTGPVPKVRTFALTDLTQAWMARRAAQRGIAEHDPRAIVYFSISAALLWPAPGAIVLDSVAAENRPGRDGVWQRPVERRRLRQAPLLLVWSEHTLDPIRTPHAAAVLAPFPVDPSPGPEPARDVEVLTYAADPDKRRLHHVIDAWNRARRPGETLLVTGLDGFTGQAGVEGTGPIDRAGFRALLRRTKVFVAAPRREDYGIAALEALAEGCQLVTTPSPGPYPARDIARAVDPRLVTDDIAAALRTALDDPRPDYAAEAAELLAPFATDAVDAVVAGVVLPRLLPAWSQTAASR